MHDNCATSNIVAAACCCLGSCYRDVCNLITCRKFAGSNRIIITCKRSTVIIFAGTCRSDRYIFFGDSRIIISAVSISIKVIISGITLDHIPYIICTNFCSGYCIRRCRNDGTFLRSSYRRQGRRCTGGKLQHNKQYHEVPYRHLQGAAVLLHYIQYFQQNAELR